MGFHFCQNISELQQPLDDDDNSYLGRILTEHSQTPLLTIIIIATRKSTNLERVNDLVKVTNQWHYWWW